MMKACKTHDLQHLCVNRKRGRADKPEPDQEWDQNERAEVKGEQEGAASKVSGRQTAKAKGRGSSKKPGGRGKKKAEGSEIVKTDRMDAAGIAVKQEEVCLTHQEAGC